METQQLIDWIRTALVAGGFLLVLVAGVIDVRHFRIPNWLNAALLALGVGFGLLTDDFFWVPHLGCGLLMFFAGALMFRFRLLGGGDVKFMAVVAFWAGIRDIMGFAFVTAVAGGFVSVIYLSLAWWRRRQARAADPATDFNILKQPVPYGVAIAAGAVYVFLSIVEHLELIVGM